MGRGFALLRFGLVSLVCFLASGCWEVWFRPATVDIPTGESADIVATASNQQKVEKIQDVRVIKFAPATVEIISGAGCGTLIYSPPTAGPPMTSDSLTVTTDHLGRIAFTFQAEVVINDVCKAVVKVGVTDSEGKKENTLVVKVHPKTLVGSPERFQPENPKTVTPIAVPPLTIELLNDPKRQQYVVYEIRRVRGESAFQRGMKVCIACPKPGGRFPGGVMWGSWLTITPTPGVQLDLDSPTGCMDCVQENAFAL